MGFFYYNNMAIYLFEKESTGEVKEVFQNMNDEHVYFGENGKEKDWHRIFTVPTASIDSKLDPFNANQYVRATANKKGTYGDLLNKSGELSEQRAALSGGIDPIKENYYKEYSKNRRGAIHQDKVKKTFENKHVKVEL